MKIIHVSNGWEQFNGAANIARMIGASQQQEGHEVQYRRWVGIGELRSADEVWIHCGWMPCLWWASLWAKRSKWMPEACYDPVRLRYHGWKKLLAGPVERWCLRRVDVAVAACAAEAAWIRGYEPRVRGVEVLDVKKFFRLPVGDGGATGRRALPEDAVRAPEAGAQPKVADRPLHLLYLGRRHPLKGLDVLEAAVASLRTGDRCAPGHSGAVELRVVSNAFGEEKERVWDWCDVLVLPTLSENFGLVVAEALARGKRVVTTDGAPAWEGQAGVVYLKGYRDGTSARRVELLADALARLANP